MEKRGWTKRTKQKVLAGWLDGWHYMPIVKFNLDCSLQNVFFFSFGNGKNINFFRCRSNFICTQIGVLCIYVERGLSAVPHLFIHVGQGMGELVLTRFFFLFSLFGNFRCEKLLSPEFLVADSGLPPFESLSNTIHYFFAKIRSLWSVVKYRQRLSRKIYRYYKKDLGFLATQGIYNATFVVNVFRNRWRIVTGYEWSRLMVNVSAISCIQPHTKGIQRGCPGQWRISQPFLVFLLLYINSGRRVLVPRALGLR